MKKKWSDPIVFFDPVSGGGNGSEIGEGSGQGYIGGDDDFPCAYEMWSILHEELDYDGDGEYATWDDYVKWMTDHGWAGQIQE